MNVSMISVLLSALIFAAMPSSTNYSLNSFGFGSGGTANSTSANYGLNATAGEQAGKANSANYNLGAGEKYVKQGNVPTISLVNSARWYNKLLVTIGTENNPSDATYSIEISADNFVTTQYVKADHTVGATSVFADYLTFAGWGGGSGSYIVGLDPGTTYSVRASAFRGRATESGYGPAASAATSPPLLTFDIDVAPTDVSTSPPYQVSMGDLLPASIVDSTDKIWTTIDTNAESGGLIYMSGQNGGLRSSTSNYTISSLSGDLAGQSEGFGAQVASVGQASGGPLAASGPYGGSGQIIGVADSQIRTLFTAPSPIVSGRGSVVLKAKSAALTPASSDYTEILTVIAAANF